jgi:hypothetical protein
MATVTESSANNALQGIICINTGEVLVPMEYARIRVIAEDRAVALPPRYAGAMPDVFSAQYLIDIPLNRVLAVLDYEFAGEFGVVRRYVGEYAVFQTGDFWVDARYGLIDRCGYEMLPPIYGSINHFTPSLLLLGESERRRGGVLVCTVTWEEVLPWHNHIGTLRDGLAPINYGGEWRHHSEGVEEAVGGMWGFIDAEANILSR